VFIAFFYNESHQHQSQQIDWLGAVTLIGAVVCLIFGLELGGKTYAWNSWQILGLFAGFAVLALLFVFAESRAKEPIISFNMFRNRVYWSSNVIAMFSGAAFITASVYIPIFIQGVLGGKATNSGLVLLPMMLGSVITASMGGVLMTKIKYRNIMIPTLALLVLGLGLLTTLDESSSLWTIRVFMVLVGLGVGASFSVLSNAAMNAFEPQRRGAASSTLNFLRSLGMTMGITIFGIVQSQVFTRKMNDALAGPAAEAGGAGAGVPAGGMPEGLNLSDPHALLSPELRQAIPPQVLEAITHALSSSIVQLFAWAAIPAALALIAAFFMGKEKMVIGEEQGEYTAGH
jgi:predicted MFS family arabinose efflux permease